MKFPVGRVGGAKPFRRLCTFALWLAVVQIVTVIGAPAAAQEPIDCGRISIKLSDEFSSPICRRSRFRTGGTIGRSESAFAESRDYLMSFHLARSGAGNTYLNAISIEQLFDWFGMDTGQQILGPEQEIADGFDYVSVGAKGLDSCILFLKQVRPIRDGYRSHYYGLACDKSHSGAYDPAKAEALLALVEDY